MDTIFMNSRNSKTSDPHWLLLNLLDKINLKRSDKYVSLTNLSFYYTSKNIKKWYKNNNISAPTQNEEFELPYGSYFVSDIQHYFEYILKKHGEKTDNSSIRIYVIKTENRITIKNKLGYFLTPETMKLLGSTKSKITKDVNGKNVSPLEITVVLVPRNIVNNDYQHDSRV